MQSALTSAGAISSERTVAGGGQGRQTPEHSAGPCLPPIRIQRIRAGHVSASRNALDDDRDFYRRFISDKRGLANQDAGEKCW